MASKEAIAAALAKHTKHIEWDEGYTKVLYFGCNGCGITNLTEAEFYAHQAEIITSLPVVIPKPVAGRRHLVAVS